MTTIRQKRAVDFCEKILDVEFKGNINNHSEVSNFLNQHLQKAKQEYLYSAVEFECKLEQNNLD